jgi:hypothetical protein
MMSEGNGSGIREYDQYASEELLDQARANAQAALIATVGFLEELEIPIDSWTQSIGVRFARGWQTDEGWSDAGEFLDAMLVNLRAIGATVDEAVLGDVKATAVIDGFPDLDLCALFEVDSASVAKFHDASGAIAGELGLIWTWSLESDGKTRITVERPQNDG